MGYVVDTINTSMADGSLRWTLGGKGTNRKELVEPGVLKSFFRLGGCEDTNLIWEISSFVSVCKEVKKKSGKSIQYQKYTYIRRARKK